MKITIQAGTNTYLIADKTIAVDGVGCYEGRLKNQPALVRALSRVGSAPLTLSLNIRNDDGFIPDSVDLWAASVAIVTDAGYEWHGKITAYDSDGAGVLYASVTEKSAPELRIQIPDEVARVVTVDENFHQSAVNVTLPLAIGGNTDNPIALKGILIDKTQGIYLMCVGEIRQFVSIRVGDADIPIAEAAAAGYATFVGTSGQTSYPGIAYVQITDPDKRKNDDGSYVEVGAKVVGLKLGTHTVEECRNGARFLYWLLKEPVEGGWGLGVSEAEIDLVAFTEAIARVDAAGLKMDGVFYFRQPAQSWIDQICQAIRGSYEIGENGKRRLFVNADAASVKTYTKKNVKLLRKGKGNYVGRVFNKGKLDFDFNPITGLFMQSAFYENASSIDDIGEQLFKGQSYLIRDMATAQAILDYTCQKSQIGADKVFFETTELPENPRTGQIITFDYPEKSLTGTWQITKLDISKNIHTVEAEKFASGIFVAGAAGTAIDWAYDPPVVSPVNPGQPSGLNLTPTIETNPDGTANVGISGTFTLPAGGYIGASVLWGEGDPPTVWNDHGLFQNGGFKLSPLKPGTKYYVKVRMVTTTGKSDYIAGSVTTAGDTTPPGVPSIAVSTSLKRVTVNITLADPPNDMGAFWIYRNTVNDSGSATRVGSIACPVEAEGRATFSYEETASYSQELFFWVKAVDKWKNPSGFSTAAGPINMNPLVYSDISNQLLKMPTGSKFRTSANGCTTASIAEVDGVKDVSFNGNHGQAIGGVSVTNTSKGKAFNFDGVNDKIDLGNPADLQITGSLTMLAWVYNRDTATDGGGLFCKKSANSWAGIDYGFVRRLPGSINFAVGDGVTTKYATATATENAWERLAGVFDSATQKVSIYKNGELVGSVATGGVTPKTDGTLAIGGDWYSDGSSPYFDGLIFDPRIYDRALSAAEIKSDYMLPQEAVFAQVVADYIGANAVRAKHMAIDEAVISVSAQIANAIIGDAHIESLHGGKIQTGTLAITGLESSAQNTINTASSNASTALENAATAQTTADNAQLATQVRALGQNQKLFSNVCGFANNQANVTGYLIIRTPITSPYMCRVKITGYNYQANTSNFELSLSFYAYTTGSFLNTSYTAAGNFPPGKVQLARDGNGKTVIVVGLSNTVWQYPNIAVPEALIGFHNPPDSYKDGWTASISTDLSGLSGFTELSGLDLQKKTVENAATLATWAWTNNTTYIDGASVYAGTVGTVQLAAQAVTADKVDATIVKTTELQVYGKNRCPDPAFVDCYKKLSGLDTGGNLTINGQKIGDWVAYRYGDTGTFTFGNQLHFQDASSSDMLEGSNAIVLYSKYSLNYYSGIISSRFPVKANVTYTASCYARERYPSAGYGRLLIRIYWYKSDLTASSTMYNNVVSFATLTDALARYSGTANAPSDAAFAQVSIFNIYPTSGNSNYNSQAAISAVQFEEGSTATVWVNREQGTVTADRVVTGELKSLNYSTTTGSMFDLDAGDLKLGGSSAPKFSFTTSTGTCTLAGFTIDADDMTAGSSTNAIGISTDAAKRAFWAGSTTPTSAPFQIKHDGTGKLAGFDFSPTGMESTSTFTSVDYETLIYATNSTSQNGLKNTRTVDVNNYSYVEIQSGGLYAKSVMSGSTSYVQLNGTNIVYVGVPSSSDTGIATNGKIYAAGSFFPTSDESVKSDIADVSVLDGVKRLKIKQYRLDEQKILEKRHSKEIERNLKLYNKAVADTPLPQFDVEDYRPHAKNIGVMAADFNDIFGTCCGDCETYNLTDAIGVALRAIQELAEIVDRQQEQIQQQNERIKQLEDMFKPSESAPDDGEIIITQLKGE